MVGPLSLARQDDLNSSPHPVTACAGHHLADKTLINAKTHMYLDGLLWNQVGSPIGLYTLGEFGLLKFRTLGDS